MRILAQLACLAVGFAPFGAAVPAHAEVALEGTFLASDSCPAFQSIRRQTNPGDIKVEAGKSYELFAGNKPSPSHFMIKIEGAQPERRWVEVRCGTHMVPADGEPMPAPQPGPSPQPDRIDMILAISWQPGFCETKPDKTECQSQTEDRFDATHLSLHGLWPQPRANVYCQVPQADISNDKAGKWDQLPEVIVEAATRAELDKVMPGTQSRLERHEWIKHGACYGDTMEAYFADSLQLMRQLNESPVQALFAGRIGAELSSDEIADAFEEAFGAGAGSRIRVSCSNDPSNGRRMIGEITIALSGPIDSATKIADLIFAAAPTDDRGCPKGVVDKARFQ